MCPLYPLHLIFTYGFFLLCAWFLAGNGVRAAFENALNARFALEETAIKALNVTENNGKNVTFYIDDLPIDVVGEILIQERSDDNLNHLEISPEKIPIPAPDGGSVEGTFQVTGSLLGFSKINLILSNGEDKELLQSEPLEVTIYRGNRTLDKIFIHVIILLVIITYINMGCAIDLSVVKDCLIRPIGPAIGLACQYIFMPIMAYSLGYLLFRNTPELWLGLFLTGCAPGGGGSNMWTYLLDGSLDLSITMTFVSTVVAFGALPLWVYVGSTIFQDGYYDSLPYKNIAMLVLGLVVPCGLGVLIRRYLPKAAEVLKRMLKPIAALFIVFVMTFGIYANLYMFSFFTWKVIVAGFCLPFAGFVFGGGASALLCHRKWEDVVAISIETGVQNTGLAIGVIKVALRDLSPLDDICMVMPVAVATMTPLPLAVAYAWKRLNECRGTRASKNLGEFNKCNRENNSEIAILDVDKAVANGVA